MFQKRTGLILLSFIVFSSLIMTGKTGFTEEGYTPPGHIELHYNESELSRYRNYSTAKLISSVYGRFGTKKDYAIRALSERPEEKDSIIILIGGALSNNDVRVRTAAFNALVELGEKELAEAVEQSMYASTDDLRLKRILELKNRYTADIYLQIFRLNKTDPVPAKILQLIITNKDSRESFGITADRQNKVTEKIIQYCQNSFASWSDSKKKAAASLLLKPENDSLNKILIGYSRNPLQTEMIIRQCHKEDPVQTENALLKSLRFMRITLRSNPVPFVKSIAGGKLAGRIIDYIISGKRIDDHLAVQYLAAWPVDRAKDKLKLYIKSGRRKAPLAAAEAGKLGDKSFTPVILAYMQKARSRDSEKCIEALGCLMDRRAVEPLRKILDKGNSRSFSPAIKAMTALSLMGDKSAVPSILSYAKRFPSSGQYAVEALTLLPSREAVPYLYSQLKLKRRSYMGYSRYKISDALVMCGKDAVPWMLKILSDNNAGKMETAAALRVLGKTGEEAEAKRIIPLLNDNNVSVKSAAAIALGDMGYTSTIPEILKASSERNASYNIRKALIMMGKPGIPVLKKYAGGRNSKYKTTAAEALIEIYNAYAAYRQGCINMKIGKYSEAAGNFSKALSIKPNFYKAKINMGVCRYQSGKYSTAIALFRDVWINSPSLREGALINMGAAWEKKSLTGKASQYEFIPSGVYTERALGINKNSLSALYNRAWLKDQAMMLPEAMNDADRAIELDSSHPKALILKAIILGRRGDKSRAKELFEEAGNKSGVSGELKKSAGENIEILQGEEI